MNEKQGLKWTCLTYRHTYATQRAPEGWSLHLISREMGNSPAVVDQYYAEYIASHYTKGGELDRLPVCSKMV